MKSLFDRTRVYAYADTPDAQREGADGIAVTLKYGEDGRYVCTTGEDIDTVMAACRAEELEVLLFLADKPEQDDFDALLMTLVRRDMTERCILASPYHRMLDEAKQKQPGLRITPICSADLVRPWIYAAYMGAGAYLAEARELLLGADQWGCPEIDRAHNANVCIFAMEADDEDTVRALVRIGCDAILTHDPEMARALVW